MCRHILFFVLSFATFSCTASAISRDLSTTLSVLRFAKEMHVDYDTETVSQALDYAITNRNHESLTDESDRLSFLWYNVAPKIEQLIDKAPVLEKDVDLYTTLTLCKYRDEFYLRQSLNDEINLISIGSHGAIDIKDVENSIKVAGLEAFVSTGNACANGGFCGRLYLNNLSRVRKDNLLSFYQRWMDSRVSGDRVSRIYLRIQGRIHSLQKTAQIPSILGFELVAKATNLILVDPSTNQEFTLSIANILSSSN